MKISSNILFLEPWESPKAREMFQADLVLQRKYKTRDNPQYVVLKNKGSYNKLYPGALINMSDLQMYIGENFEEFL